MTPEINLCPCGKLIPLRDVTCLSCAPAYKAGMEAAAEIAGTHAVKLTSMQFDYHTIEHEYQIFTAKIQTSLSITDAIHAAITPTTVG